LPPAFDHCIAAFEYRFPVNQLITGFKHGKKLEFGSLLAELWLENCHPAGHLKPDIIIPVPLHWRRQFARGFNQAELLANYYSRKMQIECRPVIKRHRATAMQQGLSAAARRKNLKNAFSLPAKHVKQTIEGRHIALVDDVVTTGSTAQQLALQCKRAGASRVDIWCLARTP
jgi:ComF family protein